MKSIYYNILSAIERIKEIILFIPTLYKCRVWDYSSLYLLLIHWIKRMQTNQLSSKHHTDALKIAKQMQIAIELLQRLYDENYLESFDKEHAERWGVAKYSFDHISDEYCTMSCSRAKASTVEEKNLERKEYFAILEKGEYLRKQDIEYFCKIFSKHHTRWWD